jgi:hypothetical protein
MLFIPGAMELKENDDCIFKKKKPKVYLDVKYNIKCIVNKVDLHLYG